TTTSTTISPPIRASAIQRRCESPSPGAACEWPACECTSLIVPDGEECGFAVSGENHDDAGFRPAGVAGTRQAQMSSVKESHARWYAVLDVPLVADRDLLHGHLLHPAV